MRRRYLYPPSYYPYRRPIPPFAANYYPSYIRDFPPANPELFMRSAKQMKILLKDAELLMGKISESREFAAKIMDMAQQSKSVEVGKILQGSGIKSKPVIKFNPDGLSLIFHSKEANDLDCCNLQVVLRWG
ncbi:hypothetical protein [Falsibacillus pallidus]|uniref:hypothetical protein n=1 Tax=Falsibacillus pallidus TaxID=493781 RepID=UPI003D9632E8